MNVSYWAGIDSLIHLKKNNNNNDNKKTSFYERGSENARRATGFVFIYVFRNVWKWDEKSIFPVSLDSDTNDNSRTKDRMNFVLDPKCLYFVKNNNLLHLGFSNFRTWVKKKLNLYMV